MFRLNWTGEWYVSMTLCARSVSSTSSVLLDAQKVQIASSVTNSTQGLLHVTFASVLRHSGARAHFFLPGKKARRIVASCAICKLATWLNSKTHYTKGSKGTAVVQHLRTRIKSAQLVRLCDLCGILEMFKWLRFTQVTQVPNHTLHVPVRWISRRW